LPTDDIESQNKFNEQKIIYKNVICCYIIGFYFIVYSIWCLYSEFTDNNSNYLNNETNYQYDFKDVKGMIRGHIHHYKTCDDYKYGCCEIYYGCNNNISKSYKISNYRIIKLNKKGTNCPSLEKLIDMYNNNFDSNCNNTHTCCEIDVGCDLSQRKKVNYLKKMVKLNYEKSNCPNFINIIHSYENYFNNYYLDYLIIMLLLFLFVCLNSKRK